MSNPDNTLPPTADASSRDSRHNLGSWISHWAATAGKRDALVFEGVRYTYRDFEDQVARLAQRLRDAGVVPGDRVALLLDNHPAYLTAVFASARIGAISLPVNTRLAPAELEFILTDAEPRMVLVDDRGAALLDATTSTAKAERPVTVRVPHDPGAWVADLAAFEPLHGNIAAVADDPMMLMYSSGTTGTPKGALLPQRKALFNSLNAEGCFSIEADDRCLVFAPLFHSLGLHILSIPVVHAGACIVLQSSFDAQSVLDSVERERITYMGGVPTHYERILARLQDEDAAQSNTTSLRFMFGAGAAVASETIRTFSNFGLVLKQGYGQTETSMLCCLEENDAVRKAGSVGRPLEHLDLRVVEPESLAEPSSGWRDIEPSDDPETAQVGEIVVRGPITMLGYWRNDSGTRETLRDGWVLTGDLAQIDREGFITLVGRSREMFISGGENVYPAEIEAAFLKHPDIAEIAVAAQPDERWGEVGIAFVVMKPGRALDPHTLSSWASDKIARFKIPQGFRTVDELPKTASGKVQKFRLLQDT